MKKSNHAVGECYKAGEFIDLHRDLNIHDPNNQYQWVDARLPWWVRPLRVLGVVTAAAGVAAFFWAVVTLMLILGG